MIAPPGLRTIEKVSQTSVRAGRDACPTIKLARVEQKLESIANSLDGLCRISVRGTASRACFRQQFQYLREPPEGLPISIIILPTSSKLLSTSRTSSIDLPSDSLYVRNTVAGVRRMALDLRMKRFNREQEDRLLA
jgi:hypothetical protein